MPSDVHGFKRELKAILDQLPYQRWYTDCVVGEVEKLLGPAESEELSDLPEAKREQKLNEIAAKAGPNCEKKTNRPPIDPNASGKELDLLRAGYLTSMKGSPPPTSSPPPRPPASKKASRTSPTSP